MGRKESRSPLGSSLAMCAWSRAWIRAPHYSLDKGWLSESVQVPKWPRLKIKESFGQSMARDQFYMAVLEAEPQMRTFVQMNFWTPVFRERLMRPSG